MGSTQIEALEMKLFRPLFFVILLTVFAHSASAQTDIKSESSTEDLKALTTLRHDLGLAISSMAPCIPIYQGHCGNARGAVHNAISLVDSAITAINPPSTDKEVTKPPVAPTRPGTKPAEKSKTEPAKPVVASTPVAKATSTSDAVAPKETEEQKIAASQASLRKGAEAIQLALKDLKAATPALADAAKVQKFLELAAAEATKAIALHASQG